jgi:Bacterial extracellular solute-binding proteins, family 5 Middle
MLIAAAFRRLSTFAKRRLRSQTPPARCGSARAQLPATAAAGWCSSHTGRSRQWTQHSSTRSSPPQLHGLAYDALVAFDHTGGPQGLRLVPDLALALPTPSDGGRTYAFRLRAGIRYSDGRPLRAGDVRRAFERLYRLSSPITSHVGAIAGASESTPSAWRTRHGTSSAPTRSRAPGPTASSARRNRRCCSYETATSKSGRTPPSRTGTQTRSSGGSAPQPPPRCEPSKPDERTGCSTRSRGHGCARSRRDSQANFTPTQLRKPTSC